MRKRRNLDMTHGPLLGKILLFSVPVMLTSLLQVAFNAADVIVVGQFAGYSSLAAVGSSTDRKSTRLNSSHSGESRMPSSA